ncbi:MAG: MoxR family ATPase [Candidatus Micrarchaeia archaeon]
MREITRADYERIIETCEIKGQDEVIIKALRYIRMGYPIMLYGPPGNGKTTLAEHLLKEVGGGEDSYLKIEATEGMTEYQLIGGFHPLALAKGEKVFKEGVVTRALREGKNLLIDEFTRAPTSAYSGLFLLLSRGKLPLEHEETELVMPKGWVLITTANLGDEGTFKISTALKRRFIPIFMDYPPRAVERAVLVERSGLTNKKVLEAILTLAEETRRVAREEKALPQGLSPDSTIKMARYCELALREGVGPKTAFLDAAFQQAIVVADEQDEISINTVKEIALDIAETLGD